MCFRRPHIDINALVHFPHWCFLSVRILALPHFPAAPKAVLWDKEVGGATVQDADGSPPIISAPPKGRLLSISLKKRKETTPFNIFQIGHLYLIFFLFFFHF